jgi:hypothetical protein
MDGVLAHQATRQAEQGIDSWQCDATEKGDIGATGNPAVNKNLLASHALLGFKTGATELSLPRGWNSYHNITLQGHLTQTTTEQLTGTYCS